MYTVYNPIFAFNRSDNLKIYNWNGTSDDDLPAKTLPFKLVSHIIDMDCLNAGQRSVGDQRKRSSETFAIGSSDGKFRIDLQIRFIHVLLFNVRKVFHHSQIGTYRESHRCP